MLPELNDLWLRCTEDGAKRHERVSSFFLGKILFWFLNFTKSLFLVSKFSKVLFFIPKLCKEFFQ